MINIAKDWPGVGDTTSPAEIDNIAAVIAALPTPAERHQAIACQREKHSKNVADMIERAAKRKYSERTKR